MHIKSIVSDEDREELERMLSLGFIILPYPQLCQMRIGKN